MGTSPKNSFGSLKLAGCGLELSGLAKVEFAFRSPAALPADEFGISNELFVMREVLGQISHIFHIAQMLIVLQMRHINLLSVSGDLAHFEFLS